MSIANKIKQYKALRQMCINQMNDLKEFAERATQVGAARESVLQFKVMFEQHESVLKSFKGHHQNILTQMATIEEADLETEEAQRKNFEYNASYVRAVYLTLFDSNSPDQNQSAISENPRTKPNIRLPRVEIPKFSGEIKQFRTFLDMYRTLVHENDTISDIEKFNYQVSSLEGPALAFIQCTPLCSENYTTAFDAFVARYDKPRLIAFAHIQSMDNAPVLSDSKDVNSLRLLIDIFTENISALKNMGFNTDEWDFLLYMLCKHLNDDLLTKFETEIDSNIPTFDQLKKFITKQCNALESVELSSSLKISKPPNNRTSEKFKQPKFGTKPRLTNAFFGSTSNTRCILCKGNDHNIYKCPSFLNKTPHERLNQVHERKWCSNCLSDRHHQANCNSKSLCRQCHRKHHTLLHFNSPLPRHESSTAAPEILDENRFDKREVSKIIPHQTEATPSTAPPVKPGTFTALSSSRSHTNVLLSTAIVEVLDVRGNFQKIRVLIDSGSQTSYISKKCFNRLGLYRFNSSLSIQGLNEMQEKTRLGGVTCTLRSVNSPESLVKIDAFILAKLCPDMPNGITQTTWSHIANITLADPNFAQPGPIDMLLGAEVFPYILKDGRITGQPDEPVAINTIFGWIIIGKCHAKPPSKPFTTSLFSMAREDNDLLILDRTVKSFWELEEIPTTALLSPEEIKCEKIFTATHSRDSSGRYVVELPFKTEEPTFDAENSYTIARRRFYALEKRLISDQEVYTKYSNIIREYLSLGYLEIISETSRHNACFYIPHHPVIRPEKIRIVYDASAKPNNSPSLNETLLTGQKLQKDILSILLNFRLHNIVFICDIQSMFTQIRVADKHQDYQRILWRFSPEESLQEYRLTRVTFGLSCSPFLANRTIMQLAQDEEQNFPRASQILKNDVYVDDIVTGCNTFEDAVIARDQLISILKCGGFELRKWSSNKPELLARLPESHIQDNLSSFDAEPETTKILGLQWCSRTDTFCFKVNPVSRECTKRNVLSEMARVYDPLGMLAPVIILIKIFMQTMWSLGLDWDETPPAKICEHWLRLKRELNLLSSIKIPRPVVPDPLSECELHGFCDASQRAYAGVIYFKFKRNDTDNTFFIISKSKVSPLKSISIPRLELSAAVLLADMMAYTVKIYLDKVKIVRFYAWTDSAITLSWIKSPPHRWKAFVGNRVARIQEKVPPQFWNYIDSKNNPSDCASRGLMPSEIINNPSWFHGPTWLSNPAFAISTKNFQEPTAPEIEVELRKCTLATFTVDDSINRLTEKFSSFAKIQRIASYVLRFISNLRQNATRKTGVLTNAERKRATLLLVKKCQQYYFADEIEKLSDQTPLTKEFRKLGAFLDEQGILRVGGRLQQAQLTYEHKHPAILPRKGHLTFLIIDHYHKIFQHPGVQTLHFLLSQYFWILSPKRAIRNVVSKCQRCWRLNPKTYQPLMGNLPELRISQIKAFSCVGVDYAGPFTTTLGKTRGAKTFKSYVYVFVCFATKAIHLELASDLSSEAFLGALRRFISRRGRCSKIYSDCGTNFSGAHKIILAFLKNAAESESLDWHFNPPSAPHFSGLAEAGVKSMKTHLYRVVGEQVLTFEELYTVLTQIEALLNSRPLCPVSADPHDLTVLTPGHFLTLEPISVLPEPDLSHLKLNHLSRWQLLQRMSQDFWARWHREYLHLLHQRSKWLTPDSPAARVGTLVLIKADNVAPSKWHTARIVELHPGKDGIARVATVRSRDGVYKRPLVKLCPLPTPDLSE